MIDLKSIKDILSCNLLSKGDKVVALQDLLLEKGYKLLEIDEYIKNYNWNEWE